MSLLHTTDLKFIPALPQQHNSDSLVIVCASRLLLTPSPSSQLLLLASRLSPTNSTNIMDDDDHTLGKRTTRDEGVEFEPPLTSVKKILKACLPEHSTVGKFG
jgi:hypothetical protein